MVDRARRRSRVGVVISDGRDQTVTVEVQQQVRHPRYDKIVRRRKRYHVHNATNDARRGDTVRIMETRPLSKTKRWRVVEIVERAR
ncbi:MAG TPA: 30S ribosomal protein S17 [Actinobacteria bacterium]|nr:30S ribosomal protein S17 [bacterium BMS3Bbin01]HDH25832.1 30S ribosomal protein S17 [Actinomycetota bacterium]